MEQKDEIPFSSKRAMATAALFTSIFKKYLDVNVCENIPESAEEEREQFSCEILDHVIIVGGFCRDVLINRRINDIDIVVNLRELCKLQTNHLKKYHLKTEDQDENTRCIYWQRYLEKFIDDESNMNEEQNDKKEMIAMHNLNYIFNTKFWLRILKNNDILDNKLSLKDVAKSGYVSAQIVNTVNYGGINLDKQSIDFIDTFAIDKCYNDDFLAGDTKYSHFHRKSRQLSMSGISIDREALNADDNDYDDNNNNDEQKANKSRPEVDNDYDHHHDHDHNHDHDHKEHKDKKGRLKSMAVIEFKIDELGTSFGNFGFNKNKDNDKDKDKDKENENKSRPEYVTIEVPIYSGKVRYKLLNYDFSINTAILPLSNIVKLKEFNNNYHAMNSSSSSDVDEPMTWLEIVENGLGECDAIEDCTQHQILRCPEDAHEHCTIAAHPQTYVFWRIIRWMIREPSFKIEKQLISAQIKDYKHWLNQQWFEINKNNKKFMKYLTNTLEKECHSLSDVTQMLSIMNILQFNTPFIKIINEMQSVRHKLTDTISMVKNNNLGNSNIIKIFKEYQYPIEEQLFKIPSKTDEELERLKTRNAFLEDERNKKNERIQDLEEQNGRLLEKIQYLEKLQNQKNDRVPELESQNSRLLKDIQSLNDSKLQLAKNANDTIDELRKYIVKYQKVVINAAEEK